MRLIIARGYHIQEVSGRRACTDKFCNGERCQAPEAAIDRPCLEPYRMRHWRALIYLNFSGKLYGGPYVSWGCLQLL